MVENELFIRTNKIKKMKDKNEEWNKQL